MKIAIASGKGGTGKSSVAINLSYLLLEDGINVNLLDCDVEEPNCHLFLNNNITFEKETAAEVIIPKINSDLCIACRKCAEFCKFKAQTVFKISNKIEHLFFSELCHSCGGCFLVCPQKAISKSCREIGKIKEKHVDLLSYPLLKLIYGELNIMEAKSPPLIQKVKEFAGKISEEDKGNREDKNNGDGKTVTIIDAPPGTSCPALAAIDGCDLILLVTEPTVFGVNDLELAADMVDSLNIPYKIIINKSDDNDNLVEKFIKKKNVEILAKIPNEKNYAKAYSRGEIMVQTYPEIKKYYQPIMDYIKKQV
ncbi:MAG: ATP-binding protein [Oligoflexia bacterium]|nr:ATP-binding protein [Oligoflexia bacterium]